MAPFRLGIWNQKVGYLINTTQTSLVCARGPSCINWNESHLPGQEGVTKKYSWLWHLVTFTSVYLDRDYPSSTVKDFWNCGNACLDHFQSASVQRPLLCMETLRDRETRKSIQNTWEGLIPCEMNAHKRYKKKNLNKAFILLIVTVQLW